MGRPRKPVAAHLLDGTYREDRHGNSFLPGGEPTKPDWLSPEANELWDLIVPQLSGIATAVDAAELAALCDWWALYRIARRTLAEISDRKSRSYYDAQILVGAAWKQFSAIASKFGLTPSDRARLQVSPPEEGIVAFARTRDDRRRNPPLDSE